MGGDFVGFGVGEGAGPEEDVVGGIGEERGYGGREEDAADVGVGGVVFHGEGDDEEEFEIALGEVECAGVAGFAEGESGSSIFLGELADEAC